MTAWTDAALAEHLARFEDATLPRERWTPHGAHLAVTIVTCRRMALAPAVDGMRAGIKRMNRAIGVPDEAYHETVTRFYVCFVHALVGRLDDGRSDAALVNALTPQLDGPREARLRIWAHYYFDPERIFTDPAARAHWVAPDRCAFPDVPGWLEMAPLPLDQF